MLYPENAQAFGRLILPWTLLGTLRAPKHAHVPAAGLFGGLLGASTAAPAVVRVPPAAPLFPTPALGTATARLMPSVRHGCVMLVYAYLAFCKKHFFARRLHPLLAFRMLEVTVCILGASGASPVALKCTILGCSRCLCML